MAMLPNLAAYIEESDPSGATVATPPQETEEQMPPELLAQLQAAQQQADSQVMPDDVLKKLQAAEQQNQASLESAPLPTTAPMRQPAAALDLPAAAAISQPIPQTAPTISSDSVAQLQQAQQARDVGQNQSLLKMASEKGLSALAQARGGKYDPDYKVADFLNKMAIQKPEDIKDLQTAKGTEISQGSQKLDLSNKQNMSDAASNESEAMREMLFSMHPEYENVPAFQKASGTALNNMFKELQLKEQIESRKDLARLKSQELKDSRLGKEDAAKEKVVQRDVEDLSRRLSTSKARAGLLADNQKRINQAERLEALGLDTSGRVQNLDSRQIEELSLATASLLSNSNTTAQGIVKALVPRTFQGEAKKTQEWLTNNPTGLDQQSFVKRMLETVEREKHVAQKQLRQAQAKELPASDRLKKNDPDAYWKILSVHGITPEDFDESGKYSPKEPDMLYSNAQERGIKAVMDHNKVNREQAIKALKGASKL